jgi:hypothetical protein
MKGMAIMKTLIFYTGLFISIVSCDLKTSARLVTPASEEDFSKNTDGPRALETKEFIIEIDKSTEETQVDDVEIHFIVDDSESLEDILELKVKEALTNLTSTLQTVQSTQIHFYKLSQINNSYTQTTSTQGQNITTTKKYKAPNPISSFSLSKDQSLSVMESQIRLALSSINFERFYNDEKGLCFIARILKDKIVNGAVKSQIITLISNENDSRYLNEGDNDLCLDEEISVSVPTVAVFPERISFAIKSFQIQGFYRDNLNERKVFSKSYSVNNSTLLNNSLYDSVTSNQSQTCSSSVLGLVASNESVNLEECIISASASSSVNTNSELLRYFNGSTTEQSCAIGSVNINGRNYSSISEFLAEMKSVSTEAITYCSYVPYSERTSRRSSTTKKYLSDVTGEVDSIKSIKSLISNYSQATKDKLSFLAIYFNENANSCSSSERFNEHGLAYDSLLSTVSAMGISAYAGDICERDYNELLENSIGKEIRESLKLRYKLSEWKEEFFQRDFIILIGNKNNGFRRLTNSEVRFEVEASEFYLKIEGQLEDEIQDDFEIKIILELEG